MVAVMQKHFAGASRATALLRAKLIREVDPHGLYHARCRDALRGAHRLVESEPAGAERIPIVQGGSSQTRRNIDLRSGRIGDHNDVFGKRGKRGQGSAGSVAPFLERHWHGLAGIRKISGGATHENGGWAQTRDPVQSSAAPDLAFRFDPADHGEVYPNLRGRACDLENGHDAPLPVEGDPLQGGEPLARVGIPEQYDSVLRMGSAESAFLDRGIEGER